MLGGDVKSGKALEAAGQALINPLDSSPVATPQSTATPPAAAPDIADQIKKLGDLHASGLLTDAEFEAKKTELLNRM
jgi:hypothetical protein